MNIKVNKINKVHQLIENSQMSLGILSGYLEGTRMNGKQKQTKLGYVLIENAQKNLVELFSYLEELEMQSSNLKLINVVV